MTGPPTAPSVPIKKTKPRIDPCDRVPKYSATLGEAMTKNPPWGMPQKKAKTKRSSGRSICCNKMKLKSKNSNNNKIKNKLYNKLYKFYMAIN